MAEETMTLIQECELCQLADDSEVEEFRNVLVPHPLGAEAF